jgi:alpha-1,3-rhamnosyl/mannosyltransferase
MACGTPVACSYTSSLPELAGEAAVLFDPVEVEEMAETLKQVLRADKRADRAMLGLAQAAQFTWAKTAALTLGVYREAVATA